MIKVEVKEKFNLKDYNKVEIVSKRSEKPNEFDKGDIFKCDKTMAEYLSGNNPLKLNVIDIIEVEPEKIKEEKQEEPKEKKQATRKKKATK